MTTDTPEEEYPKYLNKEHTASVRPTESRWTSFLWQMISWLTFAVNFAAAVSFFNDLWIGEYDNVKHMTIIVTICGSYAALKYIHEKISGHDDGRFS